MDEPAAFILARMAEDLDLAARALHDPWGGGFFGVHTAARRATDTSLHGDVDRSGDELVVNPLADHHANRSPEKVIADCVVK